MDFHLTLEFSRDFHSVLRGELNEKLLIKEFKYKQRENIKDGKPMKRNHFSFICEFR